MEATAEGGQGGLALVHSGAGGRSSEILNDMGLIRSGQAKY